MPATVSERAVLRRINTTIAELGEKLHKARPSQVAELGTYYSKDTNTDDVIVTSIDLLDFARDLEVLGAHEEVRG